MRWPIHTKAIDAEKALRGYRNAVVLVVMTILVPAFPAPSRAQQLCPNPVVSHYYDCSTIPETSPAGAWEVGVADPGVSWYSDGDMLYIDAHEADGEVEFYRTEPSLDEADWYEIEVNVQVVQTGHRLADFGFGASDGQKTAVVWGSAGASLIAIITHDETYSAPADLSVPGTYRLVVDRSSADPLEHTARLYRDETLLVTVSYQDLDPAPADRPTHVFGMAGYGSDTAWDFVRYEVCGPPPALPPVEDQIANIRFEVEQLDAPGSVKNWMDKQLDQVERETSPVKQGKKLYQVQRHLFMMKHAGVVNGDAERVETLLDTARVTVAPVIDRSEGFRDRLRINSVLLKTPAVVVGTEPARLRAFVELDPAAHHVGNSDKYAFALCARLGVMDMDGALTWIGGTWTDLPAHLPAGQAYKAQPLDFEWDGYKEDGTASDIDESFILGATIEYVKINLATGHVQYIDSAMEFPRIPPAPGPNLPTVISPIPVPLSEVPVARHYTGAVTKVSDEVIDVGEGTYYIHTIDLDNPDTTDPVMHVLDSLGRQLDANDDCNSDFSNCAGALCGLPVRCYDENGDPFLPFHACPSVVDTDNACAWREVESEDTLRLVVRAYGNHSQGSGDLLVWKKQVEGGVIKYRLEHRFQDEQFSGTRLKLVGGWYAGDEMDLIVPSPERSQESAGVEPALRPAMYNLSSPAFIADAARGNGMGHGVTMGARISGPWPNTYQRVVLSSGWAVWEARGVVFLVNDLGNPQGDADNDGLGPELEADIGTDPDNQDTDEDGIWDGFEVLGIRGAGLFPDQPLPMWGADPLHKDVFIETDYYDFCSDAEDVDKCSIDEDCLSNNCYLDEERDHGLCVCQGDWQCRTAGELGTAFDQRCAADDSGTYLCMQCGGPVHPEGAYFAAEVAARCDGGPLFLDNPDGKPGFSLHFDNGFQSYITSVHGDWGGVDAVPPHPPPLPPAPGGKWPWDNYKYGWENHLSPIRQGIFHYGVGFPGGGGNGFVGRPGHYFNSTWPKDSGKILIHELGHNLGLLHEGVYEPGSFHNYKPHYISLMNYAYSGCSPNPGAEKESDRRCDPDFIRFSEGERRYVLDEDGNRMTDGQGRYLVHEVDPAALLEQEQWYNVSNDSNVLHDMENYIGWYKTEGLGTPWFYVDWDRNGMIDEDARKADVLQESSWVGSEIVEEALEFGPQLLAQGDFLFLFFVPKGTQEISYRIYMEEADCDPEYLDNPCGSWWPIPLAIDFPAGVASEMSAVSAEVGPGDEKAFLVFSDTDKRVCVIMGDPLAGGWQGPYCRGFGLEGTLEAVTRDDEILVYGVEPHDQDENGDVRVVSIPLLSWLDPLSWTDSAVEYQASPEYPIVSLRSHVTPAVANDPLDGRLYLVVVKADHDYRMELLKNQAGESARYWILRDVDYWRPYPGSGDYGAQWTDDRPALVIERVDTIERNAKWTLWFHGDGRYPDHAKKYWRVTSSFEDPVGTVFSLTKLASEDGAKAVERRNVSLALYRGKLRAAVAHDAWHDELFAPGYVFQHLADGVFHASLRDVNDVQIIGDGMTMTVRGDGLFSMMSEGELQSVLDANNIQDTPEFRVFRQAIGSEPVKPVNDPAWVFERR